jgi:hypothetical protein
MAHEFNAIVDPVRLEAEEIEPPAELSRVRLAREVDELGQGTANLEAANTS